VNLEEKRTGGPKDQKTRGQEVNNARGPGPRCTEAQKTKKTGIKRAKEEDRRPDDQKTQRIENKMGGGQQNCFLVTPVEYDTDPPEGRIFFLLAMNRAVSRIYFFILRLIVSEYFFPLYFVVELTKYLLTLHLMAMSA